MKNLKRLLCLLLALAMVFALAACSGDKDKDDDDDDDDEKQEERDDKEDKDNEEDEDDAVVSNDAEGPMADDSDDVEIEEVPAVAEPEDSIVGTWVSNVDMSTALYEEIAGSDPTMAQYFTFEGFAFDLYMIFNEDGTYCMYADEASIENAFNNLMVSMEDGMYLYMEDMIKAQGIEGYTVDEFLEMAGMTMDDLMASAFEGVDASALGESFNVEGQYIAEDGKLYSNDDITTAPPMVGNDTYTLDGDTLTFDAPEGSDSSLEMFFPLTFIRIG